MPVIHKHLRKSRRSLSPTATIWPPPSPSPSPPTVALENQSNGIVTTTMQQAVQPPPWAAAAAASSSDGDSFDPLRLLAEQALATVGEWKVDGSSSTLPAPPGNAAAGTSVDTTQKMTSRDEPPAVATLPALQKAPPPAAKPRSNTTETLISSSEAAPPPAPPPKRKRGRPPKKKRKLASPNVKPTNSAVSSPTKITKKRARAENVQDQEIKTSVHTRKVMEEVSELVAERSSAVAAPPPVATAVDVTRADAASSSSSSSSPSRIVRVVTDESARAPVQAPAEPEPKKPPPQQPEPEKHPSAHVACKLSSSFSSPPPRYEIGKAVKKFFPNSGHWLTGSIVGYNRIPEPSSANSNAANAEGECYYHLRFPNGHEFTYCESDKGLNKMTRLGAIQIGARVGIYWPADETFYPATIIGTNDKHRKAFSVEYDDGEREWIDLWRHEFQLLNKHAVADDKKKSASPKITGKRPRDESPLVADDDDEEDEQPLMDSSDEDEEWTHNSSAQKKKKSTASKSRKRLLVRSAEHENKEDETMSDSEHRPRGRPPKVEAAPPQRQRDAHGRYVPDSDNQKKGSSASQTVQSPKRGRGRPRKSEAVGDDSSPARRGPGRPRKISATLVDSSESPPPPIRRGPGRPRKNAVMGGDSSTSPAPARRGPGRPRKNEARVDSSASPPPPLHRGPGRPRKSEVVGGDSIASPARRGPGRPRKNEVRVDSSASPAPARRGPGRPRKNEARVDSSASPARRGPGRPRKSEAQGDFSPARRGPGRPRKSEADDSSASPARRGPGRPRKSEARVDSSTSPAPARRGPGRPRKNETRGGDSSASPERRGPGRPRKTDVEKQKPKKSSSSSAQRGVSTERSASPESEKMSSLQIGDRVAVYWADDDEYYTGTVGKLRKGNKPVFIEYDDGDKEWVADDKDLVPLGDRIYNYRSRRGRDHALDDDTAASSPPDDSVSSTPRRRGRPPKNSSSPASVAEEPSSEQTDAKQKRTFEVGDRVSVFWPDDEKSYKGTVTKRRNGKKPLYIEYDDGDTEWVAEDDSISHLAKKKRKKKEKDEASASTPASASPKKVEPAVSRVQVGTRVSVYYSDDRRWYKAKVVKIQTDANWRPYLLKYEDGEEENWIDLRQKKFKILSGAAPEAKEPVGMKGQCSDLSKVWIGARVAVWWPGDKEFFEGTVTRHRDHKRPFYIEYDDGDREWINLGESLWHFASSPSKRRFAED